MREFFLLSSEQPPCEQKCHKRCRYDRDNYHIIDLYCVSLYLYLILFLVIGIFFPVSPYNKPVRIDTVRCTGRKRHKVSSLLYSKVLRFVRKNNKNFLDLISVDLIEDSYCEQIALGDLIKIGEKRRRGQTSVS